MPPLCFEKTNTDNRRIFGIYIAQHGFAQIAENALDSLNATRSKTCAAVAGADVINRRITDCLIAVNRTADDYGKAIAQLAEQEADFLGSLKNGFRFADFADPYQRQRTPEAAQPTPDQRLRNACRYASSTFKLDAFNVAHSIIEGIISRETANRSFKDDAQDLSILNGGDKYFRNCYRLQEPLIIQSGLSIDTIPIKPIRIPGTELEIDCNVSIGPAQMKISHIMRLVDSLDSYGKPTFPELQSIRDNPLRFALEPEGAALLVGAYLKDKAMRLERGENPCPDLLFNRKGRFCRENVRILRIWQQGKNAEKQSRDPNLTDSQANWLKAKAVEHKTEALIRTFNAPAGGPYVCSVREFMKKTNGNFNSATLWLDKIGNCWKPMSLRRILLAELQR